MNQGYIRIPDRHFLGLILCWLDRCHFPEGIPHHPAGNLDDRAKETVSCEVPVKTDACGVFGVKSGVPVILMAVLFLAAAALPFIVKGFPPLPLPIAILFAGFGILLLWLGFTK